MKRLKLLLIFLIACSVLTSCSPKTANKEADIQRLLMKLKSYSCDVVFAVTNNKSTNVYKAKHLYKSPGKYRIEMLEPNELKGQTTVFNGDKAYIYHPQIKTYLETTNFNHSIEYSSFLGSFIQCFKDNGGARFKLECLKDMQCYVLEVELQGENPYRATQKVYINADNITPVKLEILDGKNNLTAQVLYENFKINPPLEDELFEMQNNK